MSEGYLNTEYAVVDRCVGTGGDESCKDVQSEEFLAREGAGDEWDGERREEERLGRRIVPGARREKDPRRARVKGPSSRALPQEVFPPSGFSQGTSRSLGEISEVGDASVL